jgi:hypothetical protein
MYQTLRNKKDIEMKMSQKAPQMKEETVPVFTAKKNIQRRSEMVVRSAAELWEMGSPKLYWQI